jgi:hypothetical protein
MSHGLERGVTIADLRRLTRAPGGDLVLLLPDLITATMPISTATDRRHSSAIPFSL